MHALLHLLRFSFAMFLLGSPVHADELLLTKNDLVQVQPSLWAATGLKLPPPDLTAPIVGLHNVQDGARLLRIYSSQGDVNGFAGILYDNRDRGHSSLSADLYPGLTRLKYGADLIADGLDFGLGGRIVMPAVVLGNSSTAMERGWAPRSLPRLAMTNARWGAVMPVLYANNHIYIYPEHRDHDAEDRFPINWPYMIISQGSSGSDQPFLNAVALTLAALPRDTFAFLRDKGLVAPTVQMILRHNLEAVTTRDDYLSGIAHPAAFAGRLVRTGRMVAQAASLRPGDIPPVVRLRVVKEDFSDAAGLAKLDERLLDTPAAIGRLWRSYAWERELVVSAEDTSAPNDRPITFEWRLLHGNPERVSIEPQGPTGRTAKIRIAWHDPWTERMSGEKGPVERRMSRVDIGVFANNGIYDGAPSFISVAFPHHQNREYTVLSDGKKRLSSIDYDAEGRGAYFDPLLYWSARWTDTARYDNTGAISGWDRRGTDGAAIGFVANGERFEPRYEIDRSTKRLPVLRRTEE